MTKVCLVKTTFNRMNVTNLFEVHLLSVQFQLRSHTIASNTEADWLRVLPHTANQRVHKPPGSFRIGPDRKLLKYANIKKTVAKLQHSSTPTNTCKLICPFSIRLMTFHNIIIKRKVIIISWLVAFWLLCKTI